MRLSLPILCCLLLCLSNSMSQAAENASLNSALLSITTDELRSHVDVLADDTFEGREAGSRGGRAAGGYLAQRFEEHGIEAAGDDGSYFQPFGDGLRNIVGYLEGRDPKLRHELIVIGAHYDHVGYGNRVNSYGPFGYVHNGADDNASGVAGLLEVLDALRSLPESPRRSIVFGFWDGEEQGLLGSKHWVQNPTVDLRDVVFSINVDMIGRLRNQKLEVYGTRSALGLRRFLSDINRDTELSLDFSWEMKSNSDHYSFFEADIPVLMFHTGLHDDYHRPSDDAHLVNAEGMQRVTRFLFNTVFQLASRENIASFRPGSGEETPFDRKQLELPIAATPPRLGVRWQPPSTDKPGILLTHVEVGSAADEAGMVVGDRLLKLAEIELDNPTSFTRTVLSAGSPVTAIVAREGTEEPIELPVELRGRPTRIGIAWREDPAELGTVVLSRVVPGSPANLAELRVGDRLYEVDGRSFRDATELLHSLTSLPSPIKLLVERAGRFRTAELDVVDAGM